MEEELDLLLSQFPALSNTPEEDFVLYLCECPYCRAPFWVMPAPNYYFTCTCGGISIYEDLMLKIPTPAEYAMIKSMNRMKTVGLA